MTRITLVHKNCARNCPICGYGRTAPVGYDRTERVVDGLMRHGFPVHLYDLEPCAQSVAIYRRTRQYELPNPGWLNVTCDFDPAGAEALAYLNTLDTAMVMSLHGSTPEVHRRSSGRDDWHAIVRFITAYPERFRLPFGINFVVSRYNLDDLDATIDWCQQITHLEFLELIPFGVSGNATSLGCGPELRNEDKRRVLEVVTRRRSGGLPFALEMDALWGPDYASDPSSVCRFFAKPLRRSYCNAGLNHFAVRLNDNKVFPGPCMATIDELAVGELTEGFELRIEGEWWHRRDGIGEPCASCDRLAGCQGGCRLSAISNHRAARGSLDRFAGFCDCLYHLTR